MKKTIVIYLIFALISVSQATVLFQEDFSGYSSYGSLVPPQVGTWTQNGGTINVAIYHTLLDGTVGPCMEFVDGTTHLVPTLDANFISYTESPIKITYDFLMRRTAISDQAFALFAENVAGEKVTYSKVYDANGTQDWISMYGKAPSDIQNFLFARDTWYTIDMELPLMPASGTFSMKYTVYDASGAVLYTKDNQTSWSENAGSSLIDKVVLQAGGGVADLTSVLIDNILIETIPAPATIWLLMLGFSFLKRRIKKKLLDV